MARGLLEFSLRRQGTKTTFIFIELLVPCIFHMDVCTYSGIYPKVILDAALTVNPLNIGCGTELFIKLTISTMFELGYLHLTDTVLQRSPSLGVLCRTAAVFGMNR